MRKKCYYKISLDDAHAVWTKQKYKHGHYRKERKYINALKETNLQVNRKFREKYPLRIRKVHCCPLVD